MSKGQRAKSEEARAKWEDGGGKRWVLLLALCSWPFALWPLSSLPFALGLCYAALLSIELRPDARLIEHREHEFGIKIDCSLSKSRHEFRQSLGALAQADSGWIHRACARRAEGLYGRCFHDRLEHTARTRNRSCGWN